MPPMQFKTSTTGWHIVYSTAIILDVEHIFKLLIDNLSLSFSTGKRPRTYTWEKLLVPGQQCDC